MCLHLLLRFFINFVNVTMIVYVDCRQGIASEIGRHTIVSVVAGEGLVIHLGIVMTMIFIYNLQHTN